MINPSAAWKWCSVFIFHFVCCSLILSFLIITALTCGLILETDVNTFTHAGSSIPSDGITWLNKAAQIHACRTELRLI